MKELVLLARQEAREEDRNGRPAHAQLLRRLADEIERLETRENWSMMSPSSR